MFTHVLVPLDGSDASEDALATATEIAKRFDARMTLLTVMLRPPESRIHVPKLDERSIESGRSYLEDVRKRHALAPAVEARVELGMPGDVIVDLARGGGYDLIVMSTHGTTGTDVVKHTMGSVAWKVLQNAPCPVLLNPIRSA